MSDLHAFQGAFAAALRRTEPWGANGPHPELRRALAVHRNNAARAAQEALAENYPVTRALVGGDAFSACAEAYFEGQAPRDPRLCFYGGGFSEFVASYAPFAQWPYLKDIAALEWLCTEALFAADAQAFDGGAFAAGVDRNAKLALHPATRYAAFSSPAVAIWQAHQGAVVERTLETIAWREEIALVTRPRDAVEVVTIDRAALSFLTAIAADKTVLASASAAFEPGLDLAAMFTTLISAGAFACRNGATLCDTVPCRSTRAFREF